MKIAIYKSNDTKKVDTIRGQNPCQTRNVGLDLIRSCAILFVIAGHFSVYIQLSKQVLSKELPYSYKQQSASCSIQAFPSFFY